MFQVDLWSARGAMPHEPERRGRAREGNPVLQRHPTITDTWRVGQRYRRMLREVLEEMPPEERDTDPWCQHAAESWPATAATV